MPDKPETYIDNMYEEYLKKIGLPHERMTPNQNRQLKQAFIGGISSLIILQKAEFPNTTQTGAQIIMDSIEQEIRMFWGEQMN
jgi:hypothetical protein